MVHNQEVIMDQRGAGKLNLKQRVRPNNSKTPIYRAPIYRARDLPGPFLFSHLPGGIVHFWIRFTGPIPSTPRGPINRGLTVIVNFTINNSILSEVILQKSVMIDD